jgi:hypothetical protein
MTDRYLEIHEVSRPVSGNVWSIPNDIWQSITYPNRYMVMHDVSRPVSDKVWSIPTDIWQWPIPTGIWQNEISGPISGNDLSRPESGNAWSVLRITFIGLTDACRGSEKLRHWGYSRNTHSVSSRRPSWEESQTFRKVRTCPCSRQLIKNRVKYHFTLRCY